MSAFSDERATRITSDAQRLPDDVAEDSGEAEAGGVAAGGTPCGNECFEEDATDGDN